MCSVHKNDIICMFLSVCKLQKYDLIVGKPISTLSKSITIAGSFLGLNTHCHGSLLALIPLVHGCYKLLWQSTI